MHEGFKSLHAGVLDHAGDDVAFALHGADDNCLGVRATMPHATLAAGAAMLVVRLAADERFVNLDVADESLELLIAERRANLVHIRSAVLYEPKPITR